MDRPVVPLDAVERRMKVERRHSDQRGRAHGFGRLRIRHRLSGRRRSAADPHVGLARHALDHDVDQLRALLVRYRRELAERPEDEQMVDTGLGNGARVPGVAAQVERPVRPEQRGNGHGEALERHWWPTS